MTSYFRLAAEALPDPGTEGSWERRMIEGIRNLGTFDGRTVGRFGGQGSWAQQLVAALSPKPRFPGRTTSQLLVNGSKRALWLACLNARANVSPTQTADFTAPNDTPLENLPGWTQNPGNGAQPGDLKIVGNAVAQARLIENGVAYIGPPTGKHNKKNSAALLETSQQHGYIAPLVEDSGNWAGTTYEPSSGKLKADKSVNGTVTPLGEVVATVASGDQIGGAVYEGNYYIMHAGNSVAGPFSLGGSHSEVTRSGLVAKGAATDAWIDDYSADEQTSAPAGGGLGDPVKLDTTGAGTWTVPSGWTEIQVELIGAGGKGNAADSAGAGSGGGGGQYAKLATLSVTPGADISYQVGASTGARGTSASPGTRDTWFSASTVAYAQGGTSGQTVNNPGGNAAAVGSCTVNNGGTGAQGTSSNYAGGGGGGAGGPDGSGADGILGSISSNGGGGGGGGANGGSAGSASSGSTGGAGGNNRLGAGGGTAGGGNGSNGGGGGGGNGGNNPGGAGGSDPVWDSAYGPGGGGGGGGNGNASAVGGAGGTYGGGGGGGGWSALAAGGAGGNGLIVIRRIT